jgi:hypothetical protein
MHVEEQAVPFACRTINKRISLNSSLGWKEREIFLEKGKEI